MKAYIVTLYSGYNYGSALQCYALEKVLDKFNIQSKVLNVEYNDPAGIFLRIRKNLNFYFSCSINRERYIAYQELKNNSHNISTSLDPLMKTKFDRFVEDCLNVLNIKYGKLKKLASANDCKACISGSDQVWSPATKYLLPTMYLRFAPPNKRYSYAASFGTDNIPRWFNKQIRKYIKDFNKISVRESSADELLKTWKIQNSGVMLDPTLLLTENEWKRLEQKPGTISKKYLLLYFLNEPSDMAIKHINKIIELNPEIQVYVATNAIKVALKKRHQYIPLSPQEFIWMIRNAWCVCTDSFHGAVFSINFHKPFYIYSRQYGKIMSQETRIHSLLGQFSLDKQFISDDSNKLSYNFPDYMFYDKKITSLREQSIEYLRSIVE